MAKKIGINIDEASVRRVNDALDGVPEKARKKLTGKGIRKAAKVLLGEVKLLVPIGPMKRLKKASKSRSIKKSRTKIGMVVKVEHPVAANLNYGTKFIAAMGFMQQAAENKDEEVIDELVNSIAEMVKELNGK